MAGRRSVRSDADQVCTSLLDVVAVVDESGSIGTGNYKKVRTFLQDFARTMPLSPEDVRMGLVTFGTRAVNHWDLSDSRAQSTELFANAAANLAYAAGSTYTHLGLNSAGDMLFNTQKGGREGVPKMVLVMTDGASSKRAQTLSAAKSLRERGVVVVVLGVGTGVNSSECRSIAGCDTTDCPRYLQTNWVDVGKQVSTIIQAACRDLAKDAVCSDWSEFGPCEGECGTEGKRTSTRVEIAPQQPGTPPCPTCEAPQGRSCAEQSPGLIRTEPCSMPACRVDAHCGEFGPWSEWSTTCGSATRQRERQDYENPPASGGGLSCAEQNPPKYQRETESVQKSPCPVQQQPGPWGDWSECSATCGGGTRHRDREGYPQIGELNGGETLEQQGIAVRETEKCNDIPCPVDATCGEWSGFTECSKTCGGGTQERRREPWLDDAQHGGRSCIELHPEGPIEITECNTQPCPVDEVVGDWEGWGPCSEQCGGGTQVRHRSRSKVEATFGGKTVEEQNKGLPEGQKILRSEERACNNVPCEGEESSGESSEEEAKEEGGGFPTAAVAGGVAGGILAIAAGAGAFYGLSGGAASAAGGAAAEVMADAGATNPPEVERESLISAGEQTEMWAS
ncbi:uncharacterized protein EMH_0061160 [Eimeria mitis]|uniref:VWFA domain-containing protein n=1 Tax=Eimeria mitis TaxID=44415 RepID=U6JZ86_9EIME|nr:uncharacterized protein EMH_0061160 [Eimeria mitis]CDJ30759.1 hypothetical protein EMH_0061160 [Eimeria mitis]